MAKAKTTANPKTDENIVIPEEEKKVEQKPKEEKKSDVAYFRNNRYSGLTILVRGGKDDLGADGVKERARFVPFYDTWKGDVVRVGYLRTDSVAVAERCRDDSSCEEISEKEYTQAVEGDDKNQPLKRAPIPQA